MGGRLLEGRPWLAGHWIGKASLDVGSSRFWIGWVTRRGEIDLHQSQLRLRSCRSIFGRDTRSIQPGPIAIAAGVRLGCVLADAGYGLSVSFRHGLTARKLTWAVGIPRHLKDVPCRCADDLAGCQAWSPRVALRQHVPLRACVENPQDCFEHTTRWSRFAPRTSIGNSLLRKMIPDAFPLLVRELNHLTFISDRQQAAILR